MKAGEWLIEFLNNGEPYEFERGGATQHGVSFRVNAKNLDTNANFPDVKYGITAKSILKRLATIDNLEGWKMRLLATGEGLQRRYPEIDMTAPKEQQKLKK